MKKQNKTSIFYSLVALSATFLVFATLNFSNESKKQKLVRNPTMPDVPRIDSCVLAVSISNFKSFKDYDLSIWIQNNFSNSIVAPFNLSSLLNTYSDKPMLNLRLVSSDNKSMHLMKHGTKSFLLSKKTSDCLEYPRATKERDNSDIRFKFNIKDIFGEAVPEHNRFFFEYKYKSQSAEDMIMASIEDRGSSISKENFEYLKLGSYELKNDTIIGNIISGVARHDEHQEFAQVNSSDQIYSISSLIYDH